MTTFELVIAWTIIAILAIVLLGIILFHSTLRETIPLSLPIAPERMTLERR